MTITHDCFTCEHLYKQRVVQEVIVCGLTGGTWRLFVVIV